MPAKTPRQKMLRLVNRFGLVADDLKAGLEGKPFSWPEWGRKLWLPVAAEMGCTLVTKTMLEREGYVLLRCAKPVGKAYYGAPLSFAADLYILESQATKKKEGGR